MRIVHRASLVLMWSCLLLSQAFGQKFLSDDPIWNDPDRISIPQPPRVRVSKAYDFLENTFWHPDGDPNQPARNINTLGEVPDSSWFTNRISLHPMTIEALVRGPNKKDGPDVSRPWLITDAKTEGITPGFTIKDARGDTYLVKFDPLKYPQITTSAEVIGTKFFYAFGYNVPENYLAFVRGENLTIDPKVQFTDDYGVKRKLTAKDLERFLGNVPKRQDGTIQVMASLYLSGKPVGEFKYYGTRSDDPNDIFPHEDRRELRGLKVFASWLNHNDSDASNTLDMYVTEGETKYVKHHLIDFGTTLGSGAFEPHGYRVGNEYYLEWGPFWKSALTLGLWDRPWRYVDYPKYPSIGRFESAYFRPEKWRADYPHPSYDRMHADDALWATRTVLQFSDEMVRAIVRTGQLADPEAEAYLVKTLLERRDKIIRYYLGLLNPLDEFLVSASDLVFKNLGVEAKLATVESYQYEWFRFDNQSLSLTSLGSTQSARISTLPIPKDASPFLMVRIHTLSSVQPKWKKKVDVYIRNGSEKSVVGIEREI